MNPSASFERLALGLSVLVLLASCSKKKDDSAPVDAGTPALAMVVVEQTIGPEGGTIPLPSGASLEIPAGAVGQATPFRISSPEGESDASAIRRFQLEPTGLMLAQPAILRVPIVRSSTTSPVVALQWSDLNPQTGEGELNRFQHLLEVPGESRPDRLALQVPHFSFVFILATVASYQYLTKDIPARFLLPGDLLFTLTAGGAGVDWQPGHVGVFIGGRAPCSDVVSDALIEATSPNVRLDHLDPRPGVPPMNGMPRKAPEPGIRTEFGHFYLGARRAVLPGFELTSADRANLVQWLMQQVGKDYGLVLGQGNLTEGAYSCVGLAESALDSVGKGLLPAPTEAMISVPLELFLTTSPILEITVYAGEEVEIPVYGTVVHPTSPDTLTTFRGSYCKSQPCCDGAFCNTYSITASGVPGDATFLPGDAPGVHVFKWPTKASDAGRQLFLTFEMRSEPTLREDADERMPRAPLGTLVTRDSLHIKVLPCDTPADAGTHIGGDDAGAADSGPTEVSFRVSPISAVFTQATFSTAYDALISNPSGESLVVEWSGPSCGTVEPLGPQPAQSATSWSPSMVWTHAHPPCDPTTGHDGEQIVLTVTGPSGRVRCTYAGAETGVGPACGP